MIPNASINIPNGKGVIPGTDLFLRVGFILRLIGIVTVA